MPNRAPCPTGKIRFTSVGAARAAHGKAGYRIRAYVCEFCHSFHVCNADKANARAIAAERRSE